jgi:hypothetical protein
MTDPRILKIPGQKEDILPIMDERIASKCSEDIDKEREANSILQLKLSANFRERPKKILSMLEETKKAEKYAHRIQVSYNPTMTMKNKREGTNFPYYNTEIPFTPSALLRAVRLGSIVLGHLRPTGRVSLKSREQELREKRISEVQALYENLDIGGDVSYRAKEYISNTSSVMFDFDFKYGHGTWAEVEELVTKLPFRSFMYTSSSFGEKGKVKGTISQATRLLIPFASALSNQTDIRYSIVNLFNELLSKYGFDKFLKPPFGTVTMDGKSVKEFDIEATLRLGGFWAATPALRWYYHAGETIYIPDTTPIADAEYQGSSKKKALERYQKAMLLKYQNMSKRVVGHLADVETDDLEEKDFFADAFSRDETILTVDGEMKISDIQLGHQETIRFFCNQDCCIRRDRANDGTNALLSYNDITGLYHKFCFSSTLHYWEKESKSGQYMVSELTQNFPFFYRSLNSQKYKFFSYLREEENEVQPSEISYIMRHESKNPQGYDGTSHVHSLKEIFDPTKDYQIDFDNKTINMWSPTNYMTIKRDDQIKSLISPSLGENIADALPATWKLISNIAPVERERDWLLNWISVAFNTRQKLVTTPVLRGIEGTGKNYFINEFLGELFGRKYVMVVTEELLNGKFNDWFSNKVLVAWDELSAESPKDRNKIADKLKAYISNDVFQLERKGQSVISNYPSFANSIIFSNNDLPVTISPSDRRYTIVDSQDSKNLIDRDWFFKDYKSDFHLFNKQIKLEIKSMAILLRHHDFSIDMANRVLSSDVKSAMVNMTTSKFNRLVVAIKKKDMEYFDEFYDEYWDSEYFTTFKGKQSMYQTTMGLRDDEKKTKWLDEMKKQLNLGRVSVRVVTGMINCIYEEKKKNVKSMMQNKGINQKKRPINEDRFYITDPNIFKGKDD